MTSYYQLPDAAAALNTRLSALRSNVTPGTVLDIGCADGTIVEQLGGARQFTTRMGFDVEKMHDHFPVVAGDVLEELDTLKHFTMRYADGCWDTVLYLNIHHHLWARDPGRAAELLHFLVTHCRALYFDMGSVTERCNHAWHQKLCERFADDGLKHGAILDRYLWYPLVNYPMQGGVRTLIKVIGSADELDIFGNRWFVRNVASHPKQKRLGRVIGPGAFPPGPIGNQIGDWSTIFRFSEFQDHTGQQWFGKWGLRDSLDPTWADPRFVFKLTNELRKTKFAGNVVMPQFYSTQHGTLFKYDHALMVPPAGNALVVHRHDITNPEFGLVPDIPVIEEFAAIPVTIDGRTHTVGEWCDFQTVRTSRGLRFLDFDKRHEV